MSKKEEMQIEKMMSALDLTRDEAIEMLSFDKGEIDNEVVAEMEEKAKVEEKPKKPKKPKADSLAKVKMQKAKKKEDLVKDGIMGKIKEMVELGKETFLKSQEMSATKITFMSTDGNFYTVSLTKHKVKPDGFSDK